MELYLIRHAQATFQSIDDTDRGRILSDEGLLQAVGIGKYFKSIEGAPEMIITSPFRRTLETSHLIAEYGNIQTVHSEEWLESGMRPYDGLEQLSAYKDYPSLIIVGHQPDLGNLMYLLDPESILPEVPVGSVYHFSGNLVENGGSIKQLDI